MFPPFSFPCLSDHTTGALPTLPENPSTGDNTLILALEALGAFDYAHSLSFINEAIEQGISWEVGRAEALNLRGTFKSVLPPFPASYRDQTFLQVPYGRYRWCQG
jgi:hypothetical protein